MFFFYNNMLIAIYNGFTFIHYEMIGHVIEYCIKNNLNYHIYACDEKYNPDEIDIYLSNYENKFSLEKYENYYNNNLVGVQWREFYNKIFNTNLEWMNPNLFNPNNYDLIFLLTDTDIIKSSILVENYEKIICIFHSNENIKKMFLGNILVRYQFLHNDMDWILPCYEGINKKEKYDILKNKKIIVTCIGIIYGDENMEIILKKHFFKNYNEIEFHIISRKIKYSYNSSNIFLHENCSTSEMHEILKKTSYIFCIKSSVKEYYDIKLTACIPLGFSFGCQIIMPNEWYRYYNFNSVISYTDNSTFTINNMYNIEAVYNELYELIEHKNNIYNKLINEKELYFKYPDLYLLKISNIYNVIMPEIYFGLNNKLKEYFKHAFFYDNELENINEPVFIFLDKIDAYLNIIGNRKHKDIVICNINNDINIINNKIKKMKFIDIFHNKIIIFFQK